MISEVKSVDIELSVLNNEECLKFTFKENLKESDALEAIEEWKKLFQAAGGDKINVIWDCIEMTGFENKARVAWQHAIKELKKQINCVWLVTDSKMIKAGAKVMNKFISFKLKVVESVENIIISNSQLNLQRT